MSAVGLARNEANNAIRRESPLHQKINLLAKGRNLKTRTSKTPFNLNEPLVMGAQRNGANDDGLDSYHWLDS